MRVFINNAIINPDGLDWTPEKVTERDDAAELATDGASNLLVAINEHKEASGYFDEDEDCDEFCGDCDSGEVGGEFLNDDAEYHPE